MITKAQKLEIIRLNLEENVSANKIAKMFNLDRSTILYHLRNPDKVPQLRNKKGKGDDPAKVKERQLKRQKEFTKPSLKEKPEKELLYKDYVKKNKIISEKFKRNETGELIKIE